MSFAMVFPGQGSQSSGMQKQLAASFRQVINTYDEASELLGFDLWKLTQHGPPEQIDKTVVTQPLMLTAGVATARCWRAAGGPAPNWLAGHSLGEYSALVAAGAMRFSDALSIVKIRAELMQKAVPEGHGAMAAILGMEDSDVIAICRDSTGDQIVEAVNFNSPGQVVIAGHHDAVLRAVEVAKESGAKRAMMLRVSVPSHSSLMKPASDELAKHLENVTKRFPEVPVMNSVDTTQYATPEQIQDGLRRQVASPVQWVGTVRKLIENGVTAVVEAGPGKVLTALVRRIDRTVPAVCVEDPESLEKALELTAERRLSERRGGSS